MTPQEINRIQTFLGSDYEVKQVGNVALIEKKEEPIKANISSFTLSNPYSTIVFTTSHRIKEGQVDAKEFMNHIEESIESFLNRKP